MRNSSETRLTGRRASEIPQEAVHRLEAKENNVQILEIAFGDFEESDIIRLEDLYGRKS